MRIVVDVNHPAHVHYFKNFIWEMTERGHDILVTASEKDVSYKLLDAYGIPYIKLGNYGGSLIEKLLSIPVLDYKMYVTVKNFNPDLFLGFGSIRNAHVSQLINKPCIALEDTEHAKWEHILYVPFTDKILTSNSFLKNFYRKQIRFNGYIELTYLHPLYFTPDPTILEEIDLNKNDRYFILRFISWQASHDVGHHGVIDKEKIIKKLEKQGRVIISSEGALPKNLAKYKVEIPPEKFHDLLYYSTLYFGEGAKTASEAALLGTPSIYVSSLAGTMGTLTELEYKYHLLYSFSDSKNALAKAMEILQVKDVKKSWELKRRKMLNDKINVNSFLVNYIENSAIY
jgi:predicted glycosyltransferase